METRRPAHNTPIHMEFLPFKRERYKKSMWIGVLWAGLRVAMWIAHVGGKFRHGLLETSLIFTSLTFPLFIACFDHNVLLAWEILKILRVVGA